MKVEGWLARRLLARWANEGRQAGKAGGRLLWVDDEGQVVDLGPASLEELRLVAWAWRKAYQSSTSRGDRSMLARGRRVASSLGRGGSSKEGK